MWSKSFGIVFIDATKYNLMQNIVRVTQLPSKDCYTTKGFFLLWATDHIALSDMFMYLINVLTPYDRMIYKDVLFIIN